MVSGAFEKANLDVGMHSGCYKGPGVGIQNILEGKWNQEKLSSFSVFTTCVFA